MHDILEAMKAAAIVSLIFGFVRGRIALMLVGLVAAVAYMVCAECFVRG